ncbi:Centromere protein T [Apodemus speciosus]|uniref:Centromere protein T n=1 Tax=Apodemus speciosus TaxID=105296 RepID=A0ABQ0F311_APOSI
MADLGSPDGDPTTTAGSLEAEVHRGDSLRHHTLRGRVVRQRRVPESIPTELGWQIGSCSRSWAPGGADTPDSAEEYLTNCPPESSTVIPDPVVKPAQVPEVALSSRRESSRGSLELHLPELERPPTLAPGLTGHGKRKQKLRLSVFQQEVNQGLPLSQDSFNLSFVSPRQPPTVERPGLARRRPIRRLVNVGALLQDLEDKSLTSAPPDDSHRTPVAALPTDVVLEDTQPFSQPLADSSLSVNRSLPKPSHTGVEDAESTVGPRTPRTGTRPQNQMSTAGFGASPSPSVEPKDREGSSGDEETSGSPGQVENYPPAPTTYSPPNSHGSYLSPPHHLDSHGSYLSPPHHLDSHGSYLSPPHHLELQSSLSSEPLESVPAKLPSRTRTAGPRHHQDPYKAGLSHYMKLFSFYAKMPVEKAALEIVEKSLDKYFQHLCNDLEVFAAHAGRKTVKPKDLELLMRR